MTISIRNFRSEDKPELNQIAKIAFAEYKNFFEDWLILYEQWSNMSDLNKQGRIMVALDGGVIVGGVCYISPDAPKSTCFEQGWAVIRSLVVKPKYRGRGIGAKLTEHCVDKAIQNHCQGIALKTTQAMTQAIRIYESLGFKKVTDLGKAHGVEWFVYCKEL